MKELLLISLISLSICLEFGVTIAPYETQCFYEMMHAQTKYNVEVVPEDKSRFEFGVRTTGDEAKDIYIKTSASDYESIRLSKFAPENNYYSFCIRNLLDTPMPTTFRFQSGLELMELELLPDKSDNEYLDKEVNFLESQHDELFKSLENIESSREITKTMLNLMSKKIIYFGIGGFIVIIVVNYLFYREVKETLKKRKLI